MPPLFASHILTVLSQQPLTTRLPSASMTTPKSLLVWPEHVRRHAPRVCPEHVCRHALGAQAGLAYAVACVDRSCMQACPA